MVRRRGVRVLVVVIGVLAVLAIALVRPDIPRERLLARYAPPPSRFAEVEGMRVHYRDEGAGPPIVLIHGTASSLHTWDGWAARLSSHRRVVRLDLPGFGLTGPAPDRDYRAERLARVVAGLMDRLGVARADVAGNSLGGRVAITLALAHPERVRSLVLIDAAGLSGQEPPAIFRIARTPVLGRLLTVATPRWLIARNVAEVYGDPSRIDDALVDRYADLTRAEGNRGALGDRLTGPPDPDLDARLGEIHAPVLLLWGERDRWIPRSFGERFRDGIRGARLVTYPDAGHVPMEELPEATARDADRFLSEEDGATEPAASAAVPEAGPRGKILCFGDSITQADWPGKIPPDGKWVTLLGKKSDRITAINAGKNGRTTTQGLAELGKALDDHPDSAVVLIFLGVNDMKHGRPGVVERATSNMGKMVDLVRAKLPRAEVWILAPINVDVDRLTPFFKGEELGPDTVHFMKALSVAYGSLARKKGTRFLDLLGVVPPADLEDGVHADGRGQERIADAVWQALTTAAASPR